MRDRPYVTSIALEDFVSIKEQDVGLTRVRHYPATYE